MAEYKPCFPGWQLPLTHYNISHSERDALCPKCGLFYTGPRIYDQAKDWSRDSLTVLEQRMIAVIAKVTDEPLWYEKAFDPKTVKRWKREAKRLFGNQHNPIDKTSQTLDQLVRIGLNGSDDITRLEIETSEAMEKLARYEAELPQPAISDQALQFCFDELQYRAKRWQEHGLVFALGLGDADMIKSDTVVPEELRVKLAALVKDLETSTEVDWHPEQNYSVRDLVHPSLYALRYGYTRVVIDSIPLKKCNDYVGTGETLNIPKEVIREERMMGNNQGELTYQTRTRPVLGDYSKRFQWIPAEVSLDNKKATFTSYINNLKYPEHSKLYDALGELVRYSVPLWDRCLGTDDWDTVARRLNITDETELWTHNDSSAIPPTPDAVFWHSLFMKGEHSDSEVDDAWKQRWDAFHRKPLWPDPPSFEEWSKLNRKDKRQVDLAEDYPDLQVIVKLINVELTPESPRYDGETWHVEGLANEHICATSVFYYDSHNVSDGAVEFRCGGRMDPLQHTFPEDEFQGLERVYGTNLRGEAGLLNLGSVKTPQGRLLAFPNVFQHRARPFHLLDPSKPGHRKIVVLCLVNPQKPIISTEHVPPQQGRSRKRSAKGGIDYFDSLKQAKVDRILLMEDRKASAAEFGSIEAVYDF